MSELENQKHWYVLHTYSGYENSVKDNIDLRKESMGMEDNIFEVYVPEEEVVEKKDGVEKTTTKKVFPGYVLVQMIMSDQAWYIVRNTPGVTGFVGSHGGGSKPAPLLEEEVESIFQEGGMNTRRRQMDLEPGDRVSISSGAFEGMSGVVEETESEKGKVHVTVEMFGRETLAEVDYDEISKIHNQ